MKISRENLILRFNGKPLDNYTLEESNSKVTLLDLFRDAVEELEISDLNVEVKHDEAILDYHGRTLLIIGSDTPDGVSFNGPLRILMRSKSISISNNPYLDLT